MTPAGSIGEDSGGTYGRCSRRKRNSHGPLGQIHHQCQIVVDPSAPVFGEDHRSLPFLHDGGTPDFVPCGQRVSVNRPRTSKILPPPVQRLPPSLAPLPTPPPFL